MAESLSGNFVYECQQVAFRRKAKALAMQKRDVPQVEDRQICDDGADSKAASENIVDEEQCSDMVDDKEPGGDETPECKEMEDSEPSSCQDEARSAEKTTQGEESKSTGDELVADNMPPVESFDATEASTDRMKDVEAGKSPEEMESVPQVLLDRLRLDLVQGTEDMSLSSLEEVAILLSAIAARPTASSRIEVLERVKAAVTGILSLFQI